MPEESFRTTFGRTRQVSDGGRSHGKQHRNFKKAAPPKDDRTKFDKWLDNCREGEHEVVLVFDPRAGLGVTATVKIVEVDRYMLFVDWLEPISKNIQWISKSIIASARVNYE